MFTIVLGTLKGGRGEMKLAPSHLKLGAYWKGACTVAGFAIACSCTQIVQWSARNVHLLVKRKRKDLHPPRRSRVLIGESVKT